VAIVESASIYKVKVIAPAATVVTVVAVFVDRGLKVTAETPPDKAAASHVNPAKVVEHAVEMVQPVGLAADPPAVAAKLTLTMNPLVAPVIFMS
jgi:hypothetical protein